MSDAYVGEIRLFPFNYPPRGWALCQGQLMSISQNTALFSLLGTNYGGDGRSSFGLPNLQGQVPISAGQGPGLQSYTTGESGGVSHVTLTQAQAPSHTHTVSVNSGDGTTLASSGAQLSKAQFAERGKQSVNANVYNPAAPATAMSPTALAPTGNSRAHNNMQPYLVMIYCIALQGVFPPRN